jgi:glutamate-1-semialdehyde 2,1-aminomutase
MTAENIPVLAANMSSIWTINYVQACRYNWMLQYYLRDAGLALSWVGTGRFIFTLNFTDQDMAEMTERFVRAAQQMKKDGFWWSEPHLTNKSIKRTLLKEMLGHIRRPR